MKEVKDKGKDGRNGYDGIGEAVDQEDVGPATVPVAMPDFFFHLSLTVTILLTGIEHWSSLLSFL
jgi:hypothetical protein